MSFLHYMGKYYVGPKVFKREPGSTAGEGGGTEWAAETREAESANTWGPAQRCHTFTASFGGGTAWVIIVKVFALLFQVHILQTSVPQLQERVADLEGERNLLKKSYDSLLERSVWVEGRTWVGNVFQEDYLGYILIVGLNWPYGSCYFSRAGTLCLSNKVTMRVAHPLMYLMILE